MICVCCCVQNIRNLGNATELMDKVDIFRNYAFIAIIFVIVVIYNMMILKHYFIIIALEPA